MARQLAETKKRRITAHDQDEEIQFLNPDGSTSRLGTVRRTQIASENLSQLRLISSEENPFRRRHRDSYDVVLGSGSAAVGVISPHRVQEVLSEMGWELKSVLGMSGGATLQFLYEDPSEIYDEIVTWDDDFWLYAQPTEAQRGVKTGLTFTFNLFVGMINIDLRGSVYRILCSNWMRHTHLDLGVARFNHRETNEDWETLQKRIVQESSGFNLTDGVSRGKIFGSSDDMAGYLNILSKMQDDPDRARLPGPISQMWTPLSNLSTWLRSGYISQLEMLRDADMSEIGSLDLENAYTNVLSRRSQDVGSRGILANDYYRGSVIDSAYTWPQISQIVEWAQS